MRDRQEIPPRARGEVKFQVAGGRVGAARRGQEWDTDKSSRRRGYHRHRSAGRRRGLRQVCARQQWARPDPSKANHRKFSPPQGVCVKCGFSLETT